MKKKTLASTLYRSFALLLFCAFVCMAMLAGISVQTLRTIAAGQKAHADTFVPAKRLTAGFEREILNARIFFIYYVTIQKPGALDSGWQRFHKGEATLRDMATMVSQHEELANLRVPVAQLQKDVADYNVALADTLNMVTSGETKGPHYDAQVKEWAARGATMVKDSAFVENLTFKSGEANTREIGDQLRAGQSRALILFGLGFAGYLALTVLVFRRLYRHVNNVGDAVKAARLQNPFPQIQGAH